MTAPRTLIPEQVAFLLRGGEVKAVEHGEDGWGNDYIRLTLTDGHRLTITGGYGVGVGCLSYTWECP